MHGGGHQADEHLLLLIHTESLVELFGRNDRLHAPGRILAGAFHESRNALIHADLQLAHLRFVCDNGLLEIIHVEGAGLGCLSDLDDGVNTFANSSRALLCVLRGASVQGVAQASHGRFVERVKTARAPSFRENLLTLTSMSNYSYFSYIFKQTTVMKIIFLME